MVRQILPALLIVVFLSSCTAFKSLNFSGNRQAISVVPPTTGNSTARFIDDISVTAQNVTDKTEVRTEPKSEVLLQDQNSSPAISAKEEIKPATDLMPIRTSSVESASPVQLKYSVLLNTEVEFLPHKSLLEAVDEYYGVRYRKGGNGDKGIDCSGFTCAVYAATYGITLPRVSKEQYRISRKISTTELQEGDLLFFNTVGRGVSHVGVYLGNNKFIHATVHKGVMVNSLFEPYYVQRFLGAGRIDDKQVVATY
ncbi:MAG: C40 family peptidase [Sphingobacteriales bacterium]|nr:C40 family peptidase [Sphingobacteriales bacterium]